MLRRMASLTLSRPDVFPDGTTVSARAKQVPIFPLPAKTDAPAGSVVGSGTVSSGSVTFTGLADGARYELAGSVNGESRRVYVRTPETATGLAALEASATTNPNGTPLPTWRAARRARGLR